jgi:hypothetical protein
MRRTVRVWLLAAAVLASGAAPARAQVTRTIRPDTMRARGDSGRVRADSAARADSLARADTMPGRGRGLPRKPSRSFPETDSLMRALLARPGFLVTHYAADSVQLLAEDKEVRLSGKGLIQREGSILEADTVRYAQERCHMDASGRPRLFDSTGVLIGAGMQYDACNHTGIIERAKTDLSYGAGTWYLLGHMAFDNEEDRVYAASASMTSCDLTDAHYHFATRQVKWINKRFMVARPAVLYVADVPVVWLPFVFQDTRHGRRSGILAPQFGINDIVRLNGGYQRHVSNIGYYWAISDFADAQASLDWYASRSISVNGRIRYRWLDRFLAGGIAYQELHEASGSSSRRISWSHQQQFSLSSQLTANLDYASSSNIISRNAVDPVLAIGTIDSRLNYQKRFDWGTFNLGGSRTQSLDRPQVTATFPSLNFTPNPIAISKAVTWSPSFSFTNSIQQNSGSAIAVAIGPGLFDSLRTDSRSTSLSIGTPLRVGRWNFSNSVSFADSWSSQRAVTTDTATGAIRTSSESFSTSIDWTTGVGLPVLFQGAWNLQPGVTMVNTAGGPYALRNTSTRGRFVTQTKRFQFQASVAPTLFALFPGFGPISRIRHAISPSLSWSYAPAATIPLDYATALGNGVAPASLLQPARQSVSLGISQIFEAKLKPPSSAARDTTRPASADPPEGRKIKLLSLQSDGVSYDFEQAKLPGRTGWTSQTWGNTVSSDLLRGFSLRFAHDLWDGPVGYRESRFAPMLTSMTFGFALGASTLNIFRRLFGVTTPVTDRPDTLPSAPSPTNPGGAFTNAFQRGPLATVYSAVDRLSPSRGGQAFQASLNFSFQRSRAYTFNPQDPRVRATIEDVTSTSRRAADLPAAISPPGNSMVSGNVSFSPTAHWTVSWQTSYNFTQGQFSDHVIRLDRDMHDWRATFTFVKSPNGNFLFNFFLVLIDEPDLKIGYDQRTVR